MGRIYIVRHGQTAWNKEKVFRGRIDVPLNEQGFKEAEAVGEALRNANIKFVYSSPLSRAVQTATPTAKRAGLDIVHADGIIDMNFGKWEGKPLDVVEQEDPERFRVWVNAPEKLAIPGGETLDEVQNRAMAMIRDVAKRNPDDTGMIVSHRVVCKLLVLGLMGLGPDKFWNLQQDTACMNMFVIKDSRAVAFLMNDTCHLAALKTGMVTADF